MAKRILLESYTFSPSSRTVVINGRYLRREQLILITNVTSNTVIYNFADSSLTASTYTPQIVNNVESTTIILTYNTTSMGANDKLSILIEEINETIQPSETLMDPIGKLRVTTPQSLIDTDFEYGTQPTKWETISMCNNRPAAFYDATAPIGIISITASTRTITVSVAYSSATVAWTQNSNVVTIASPTNVIFPGMTFLSVGGSGILANSTIVANAGTPTTWIVSSPATATTGSAAMNIGYPSANVTVNNPVYIQDTIYSVANGWVMPVTVTSSGGMLQSFTYLARDASIAVTTNIADPTKTYVYPGSFYTQSGITVAGGNGSATLGFYCPSGTNVACTTLQPHGLAVGSGIFVANTGNTNLNGNWFVKTVPTSNSFTFDVMTAPGTLNYTVPGSTGTINIVSVVSGAITAVSVYTAGSAYLVGDVLSVTGGTTTAYVKVLTVNATGGLVTVAVFAPGAGYSTGTNIGTTSTYSGNLLFPRTWGNSTHRAFDGGVTFSTGMPYHSNQIIRQTRRYFRYQSGKGIQFNTGTNFCTPFQVDSITRVGTAVTVLTKLPHNLGTVATGTGPYVKISGCDQAEYNGTWPVTAVSNDYSFTVTVSSAPGVSPATGGAFGVNIVAQPVSWYGASLRIGMFDNQNGFFFQYDGQALSVVRRSSTLQLSGTISQLGTGSQVCVGTNTKWAEQLMAGDFIVIRGQSYTVVSIESQTSMTIYPDYRGANIMPPSQVIISKTVDLKIPQSSWNIDKCDGTGASGFNIDVTKMQMYLMDYAWYGAGAIRWGFKNHRGEAIYAHRLAHGNNMTEAYMRSGNLPARYEVNSFWPYTRLTSTLLSATTSTVTVQSTDGFPSAGTLCLTTPGVGATAYVEYINYTSKTSTSFDNLTRAVTNLTGPGGLTGGGGISTAQTFTVSGATIALPGGTAPVQVTVYAPQAAATISHWGSAVMMDGRYDDDKSLVFVAGMQTSITNIALGFTQPLISIRIAPSVDSGITGLLGQREIVNRMQLIMRSCASLSSGTTQATYLITLRLNGYFAQGSATSFPTWTPAGGSSLAQVCYHSALNTISGGETVFGFFPNGAAGAVSFEDLSSVRDLGNSIIGGGNTVMMPTTAAGRYPDGPDIITLCVTNLAAAATTQGINARISWTEAQA